MDSIDTQISAFLQSIERARKDVQDSADICKEPWKTNCVFSLEDGRSKNIQVMTIAELQQTVLYFMNLKASLENVNEFLGISESATEFKGFEISEWLADCKKRAAVLTKKAKEQRLSELEKRAQALVSAETRRNQELKALLESAKDLMP